MKKEVETGWISLHRKIQENWLYPKNREFTQLEAWIDLLLIANHADHKVLIKNEIYFCKRGQTVRSMKTLSERWSWSRSRVRRFFDLLQNDSMVVLKPDQNTTQITICNYEKYQGERPTDEHRTNIERTSDEHRTDINNNANKENKENNFLNEKVQILFLEFLKSQNLKSNNVTDKLRIDLLAEKLEKLAPDNDEHKIEIIKQAIAGGYSDFRPLPANKEKDVKQPGPVKVRASTYGNMGPSEIRGIYRCIPDYPVIEEFFIKYGGELSKAKEFFDDSGRETWAYSSDLNVSKKDGTSQWREVALKYYIPNPPAQDEVILYFDINGYSKESAMEFYQIAIDKNWKNRDGEDTAINNKWQRTAETMFFKPENRIKDEDLNF